MRELYFFDLPVYRIAYDIYNANQKHEIAVKIADMKRGRPNYEPSESTKAQLSQHQYEKYGPWRFNEIIGYIRLHFLGSQIRGEYFSAEKKRNILSRHRVFTYRTHKLAAEIHIPRNATNAEIFELIQQYIADCKNELAKNCIIDDSILSTIGSYTDWQKLLGRTS